MSRDELKAYLESLPFEQVQFYCYDHTPRVWASCGNQPITDKAVLIEKILAAKFPAPVKTEKPTMDDNSTNQQTIQATEGSTITIHGEVVGRDKTTKIFNLISWRQLLLLLLLGLLTWLLYLYGYPMYHWWSYRAKPDELLILLTDFEDNSTASYDAAEVINEKLSAAIEERRAELPNVRLQRLHEAYKRDELANIKNIGKSYSATLIIWGSYDDAGMYPRFTVIDEDKLNVKPENLGDKLVNLASPPDDFTFYLNRDLPTQVNYLTHFTLGQIFYLQKQYDSALTLFKLGLTFVQTQETTQFQRSLTATYFYMGVIWQAINHDNEQAIQDYNKAIALDPNDTTAYYNRGLAYDDQHNYEQAIQDYNKAIALDPNDATAYYNRGVAYHNQHDYEQAIQDYNKAIELDPHYAIAYNGRGIAYKNQQNYEQAIQDYNKAIALDPNYAYAYNNRGSAYKNQHNYEQAIQDYNKAIALDPNDATTYYNRGLAYDDQHNYEQAIQDYNKAIALDPNDATAYYNRGVAYHNQHDYEQAIQDYNKAIELDPHYAIAYNGRGIAYHNQHDYEQAIQDYNKAIALDPNYAYAYNNRGNAYYDQHNYEQAIQDYNKAIALDPNYANAYNNRGNAYYDQHNYEQAIQDYNKAIALDPNDASAYNNRGRAYAHMGDYSKAEADFDKAMQLLPDDPESYNNKCWWGSLLGQAAKVLTACDKAVELSDNDPGVRDSRGLARALTGDTDGAITDFEAYVAWSKENDMYGQLGKKREEWIKALQAGQNPFDEKTLQALGEE